MTYDARLLILALLLVGLAGCTNSGERESAGKKEAPAYLVETIDTPPGLAPEVGGMDVLPDGRLVTVFHHGEVMIYDPEARQWSLFARGLHDPLGVKALSAREMLVMQRPELTRLGDTDQDGKADRYRTVTNDFGMSGNYHEFAFGPVADSSGDLFIALNAASGRAGVWEITRGSLNPMSRREGEGMYAPVPYRGWVMQYDPERDTLIPWASGFRSPNGLVIDEKGRLLVTDNQGDWLGTSKLYHVRRGEFYGHPASLVWEESFEGVRPSDLPVPVLNKMREKAAVLFPQGLLSNSPTQPVVIPEGTFGPFGGQLLVGEMNFPRILRVMLEEVDGQLQGACVTFIDAATARETLPLRRGNNRLVFAPDGSLWVGQTDHGWPGGQGIQRIRWTGTTPMEVQSMHLTKAGFELTFTRPVARETALADSAYRVTRYYYDYHQAYGSPRLDVQPVEVTGVDVSPGGRRVSLSLEKLVPGYVYQLRLNGLEAAEGRPLAHELIFYTLNRLKG